MLFYFTGTGNSLYVAKGLERQPISIPQADASGGSDLFPTTGLASWPHLRP